MLSINLNQLVAAFSLALDIAENKTLEHAQRTAYIALVISREMGLTNDYIKDIYAASLLHDIGLVAAEADVHTDQVMVLKHCITGEDIVKSLPLSSRVAEYILWHHANWDGSGSFLLSGEDIPLGAQIVYLSDQLDLRLKNANIYSDRHEIVRYVKETSGKAFNPRVVEAFLQAQGKEIFWLDYNYYNMSEVLSKIEPSNEATINLAEIERIAYAFAKIIDNKSPFTHNHSKGVADLLSKLSEHYQYDQDMVRKMAISGLLHDLGKLATPNGILDKPDKLTSLEFQMIKSHPYYTKLILARVHEFQNIKEWAGNHHETLDGKGYPEGLSGEQLSRQDKMVAVCDIYQALTEERPYRQPLPQSNVFEIIDKLAKGGKLCPEIVNDLKIVIG